MNVLVSIIWLVSLIISLGKIEWVAIMKSKGMRVCNPLDCRLALFTNSSSSGFWLDYSRLLASFLVFCSALPAPPLTTDRLETPAHLWHPGVHAPSGAQVHLSSQPCTCWGSLLGPLSPECLLASLDLAQLCSLLHCLPPTTYLTCSLSPSLNLWLLHWGKIHTITSISREITVNYPSPPLICTCL